MNVTVEQTAVGEIERILALPARSIVDCERESGSRRWSPASQALVDVMTARYTLGPRECNCKKLGEELGFKNCITTLHPAQAWVLRELPRTGGIFGMLSVGSGKTLAGVLAPLAMPHIRTWVIFIKPDQRFHYRKNYLRIREHFRVPSIVFDKTVDLEGSYIVPGAPVLHVLPYSLLSNPKSTDLLEQLDPDGLILDESHLVASRISSRTMRLLRFLTRRNANGRSVTVLNWSGSTIKKSMKDASHLAAHSLGLGSPYPIPTTEVEAWSAVIDPSHLPDTKTTTAKKLSRIFGTGALVLDSKYLYLDNSEQVAIREGHRERILQTPGVISTKSASVTCSISIKERKAPKLPVTVQEALAGVRGDWLRPDGEELVEALQQSEVAREVGAGYYSYWAFPKGEPVELIERWFDARKSFSKELRVKLIRGEPHLDSRKLCENAAERAWREPRYNGELPVWPADHWPAWVKIRDKVDPDPRTKWIDDYLARDAAAWAKEHRGIVWCQSIAFGQKVAELAGINYHGGGADAESRILSETGKQSIVASLKAHGTGRDGLQFKFSKQLLAEPMSSGDLYEQWLGRLAREGQEAETVETWVYLHVSENRDAIRKAIMYAEFIESTTGNRQLLLSADCDFVV